MIKHHRMTCDLCDAELKTDQPHSWEYLVYLAEQKNWDAEERIGPHYCPSCKVPAKLARELEAAK